MRRSGAGKLLLVLATLAVASTGFATCGNEVAEDDDAAGESAGEATIEEEQEDMYRDIDR
jgi:hypothetical protein